MAKIAFRVIIFLIPIFVIIGVMRLALAGFSPDKTFMPTVDEMMEAFNQFPNISQDIQNAIIKLQTAPNFIDGATRFFELVWIILSAPVRVLVWVFQVLFGLEITNQPTFQPIITVPIL